jgi:hypothetical protein
MVEEGKVGRREGKTEMGEGRRGGAVGAGER